MKGNAGKQWIEFGGMVKGMLLLSSGEGSSGEVRDGGGV